jgi:hypothetical protein
VGSELVSGHISAHIQTALDSCISEKCRVPSDFERREVPLSAATGCEPSCGRADRMSSHRQVHILDGGDAARMRGCGRQIAECSAAPLMRTPLEFCALGRVSR